MDYKLQLSAVCNFTATGQNVVKEETIKEEQYDYIIGFQDEEEKPFAELPCTTETDVPENDNVSYNEETHLAESKTETDTEMNITSHDTLRTVEIEVKIEQDEEELDNLRSK